MSNYVNQAKSFFDTYAKGGNTSTQNVNTTTYTTTEAAKVAVGQVNTPVYETTTYTSQVPVTGTQYVGGSSYAYGGKTTYSGIGQESKLVNQTFQTSAGYSRLGQSLTQKVVAEQIPVESRIEYIPFEKKYIEYDQIERIERIPYEREIVEYEEITRTERIPVERTITDYYAVETQIEYIPKEIEETIVEYEPVERVWERVQYLPVETQIVHYPERDNYVAGQGKYIQAGYVQGGYVPSQSGVRTQTVYQTGYVPNSSSVVTGSLVGQRVQGATQYVTGPTYGATTTYTTGPVYTTGQTYVTGGSRVGETVFKESRTKGGYVTGGSGVRL